MQTSKGSKVSRRALFGIPIHIQSMIAYKHSTECWTGNSEL